MKKPILVIVAGPNGSGKTTFYQNSLADHPWLQGCNYINPDAIAQDKFGDWNNDSNQLKAALYAENQRDTFLQEKKDIIFETVLSTEQKISYLKKAKSASYFIRLFFICTDTPAKNIERIQNRVKIGKHDVPVDKIVKRYFRSINYCISAATICNRVYLLDNSTLHKDPTLILRYQDGITVKKYSNKDNINWVKNIEQCV